MRIADLTGGVDKQKQHFYFFLMTSHSCSHVYSIFTFITWEADFDKSYHSQFFLPFFTFNRKENVFQKKNACSKVPF